MRLPKVIVKPVCRATGTRPRRPVVPDDVKPSGQRDLLRRLTCREPRGDHTDSCEQQASSELSSAVHRPLLHFLDLHTYRITSIRIMPSPVSSASRALPIIAPSHLSDVFAAHGIAGLRSAREQIPRSDRAVLRRRLHRHTPKERQKGPLSWLYLTPRPPSLKRKGELPSPFTERAWERCFPRQLHPQHKPWSRGDHSRDPGAVGLARLAVVLRIVGIELDDIPWL
jgi:hypothetical protein